MNPLKGAGDEGPLRGTKHEEPGMPVPRTVVPDADRMAALDLLQAGLLAAETGQRLGYYVHPGDVQWWLDCLDQDAARDKRLQLWEQDGACVAWTLLSPMVNAADVFVHPRFYNRELLSYLWGWAVEHLQPLLPAGEPVRADWVAEDDPLLRGVLTGLGFEPQAGKQFTSLERPLAAPRVMATPPAGFILRRLAGEEELETRARASHGAFQSAMPLEAYQESYRRFMRSPGYRAAYDLVAVEATTGAVAAFALVWPDEATGLALFEPVGTHPAYQRRGLARALLAHGLDQLQAAGMRAARINVAAKNQPAAALYQSLGFVPRRRLMTYGHP
jgi:mycothiol synthase